MSELGSGSIQWVSKINKTFKKLLCKASGRNILAWQKKNAKRGGSPESIQLLFSELTRGQ